MTCIKDIFSLAKLDKVNPLETKAHSFAQNCLIFNCLLSLNANESFLSYIYDQIGTHASQDLKIMSTHLQDLCHILIKFLD